MHHLREISMVFKTAMLTPKSGIKTNKYGMSTIVSKILTYCLTHSYLLKRWIYYACATDVLLGNLWFFFHRSCFMKKDVLKNFAIFTGKLQACNFVKNTSTQLWGGRKLTWFLFLILFFVYFVLLFLFNFFIFFILFIVFWFHFVFILFLFMS